MARSASKRSSLWAVERVNDRPVTHAAQAVSQTAARPGRGDKCGNSSQTSDRSGSSVSPAGGRIPTENSAITTNHAEIKQRSTERHVHTVPLTLPQI